MENENDVDQLFKNGLNDPDIPFNELDWKRMERKLDAKQRKRIVPLWIFTASGIAAILTVILLWFFSKPLISDQKIKKEVLAKHVLPKVNLKPAQTNLSTNEELSSIKNVEPNLSVKESVSTLKGASPGQSFGLNEKTVSNDILNPAKRANKTGQNSDLTKQDLNTPDIAITGVMPLHIVLKNGLQATSIKAPSVHATLNTQPLPQQTDSNAILAQKANALAQSRDPAERSGYAKTGKNNSDELTRSIHKNMDAALAQNHVLILSAMAAPDISTAKSSKSSKISSNVGMLATYALGKKISLTSGAIYAKKYYNSTGTTSQSNLYNTTTNNWEVDADCNVLDIPLNVNYKLLNNKKLSVSVNTGLSSYFMLKEKYDFITDQPNGTQKVSSLEINNQNQHLFGIANVSVSFDHQITNSVSVGVQPFAKLPLTGIGYGDASLKSAGVSFSLNIGLFPAKKPGKYASLR